MGKLKLFCGAMTLFALGICLPAAQAQEETLELASSSICVATDLESQDLRLANGPPDLPGRRDARQVGQGAGGVGDRNAVATARHRGS